MLSLLMGNSSGSDGLKLGAISFHGALTMQKMLVAAVVALFCQVPAFADQIIGLPADPNSGNEFPFGFAYSGEYQQVYTASAFSGPLTITNLEFYNTQLDSAATAMNSGTWTIALSTTSADWNTLSTDFASNIGGDNTTVFSGNLSQPWAFGDTLSIILTTPFTYNPGNGNLLMDVMVSGASAPGGAIFFDENSANSIMGRVFNSGGIVFENSSFGLVTGFSTVPVPSTLVMSSILFGIGGVGLVYRRFKKAATAV
jgi:hypothetical protein